MVQGSTFANSNKIQTEFYHISCQLKGKTIGKTFTPFYLKVFSGWLKEISAHAHIGTRAYSPEGHAAIIGWPNTNVNNIGWPNTNVNNLQFIS